MSEMLNIKTTQTDIWSGVPVVENPDYLSRQLITCIGNKRSLLPQINKAIKRVKHRLGKNRLRCFDVFSGSGVVSRLLKSHSSLIVSNDLEDYAAVIGRCYLANQSEVDLNTLKELIDTLNKRVLAEPLSQGFIEEMYSPRDERRITKEDRVFYTKNNARRLDNYRRLIENVPRKIHDFLLAPLLSEASIHANTSGVFKGFHKNRHTKIGQFGGSGSDALLRILGDITLEVPVFSNFECEYEVLQEDANAAARKIRNMDIAYLDPPYNQHPYGSNYFMLNLITRYQRPNCVSRISGIPADWRRSGYNVRAESFDLMTDLVRNINASFLLVSFNNEGFIRPDALRAMLSEIGSVEAMEMSYNTFRGSRSFANRSIYVTEQLFLVEKRRRLWQIKTDGNRCQDMGDV